MNRKKLYDLLPEWVIIRQPTNSCETCGTGRSIVACVAPKAIKIGSRIIDQSPVALNRTIFHEQTHGTAHTRAQRFSPNRPKNQFSVADASSSLLCWYTIAPAADIVCILCIHTIQNARGGNISHASVDAVENCSGWKSVYGCETQRSRQRSRMEMVLGR